MRRKLSCTAPPSTGSKEKTESIPIANSCDEEGLHDSSLRRSPRLRSLKVIPVATLVAGQQGPSSKSSDADDFPALDVENRSQDFAGVPALDVENAEENDLVDLDTSGLLTQNLDSTDRDMGEKVDGSKEDEKEEEEEKDEE